MLPPFVGGAIQLDKCQTSLSQTFDGIKLWCNTKPKHTNTDALQINNRKFIHFPSNLLSILLLVYVAHLDMATIAYLSIHLFDLMLAHFRVCVRLWSKCWVVLSGSQTVKVFFLYFSLFLHMLPTPNISVLGAIFQLFQLFISFATPIFWYIYIYLTTHNSQTYGTFDTPILLVFICI